jgi:hypothetical protein
MDTHITRGDRIDVRFWMGGGRRENEACCVIVSFAQDCPIAVWDYETEKWRTGKPHLLAFDATDKQLISAAWWERQSTTT